jgi:cytochrome c biogenesis protein ResB
LRTILRFLSSLSLGISLIVLLTVSCIYGSIVSSDELRGVDYAQEFVFHTWWFLGLMGLLLVNLCLCSWEKSYIALTLYKKKNIIASKGFFERASHMASMPWNAGTQTVKTLFQNRYTVAHFREAAGYAQRGLLGRCGATIIHIGLLWTMAAGFYRILADDFGWGVFDSTIILPEGETTNSYFSRIDRLKKNTEDNLREHKLPFNVHALDFRADYYPHSTVARYFASLVELTDGDHTQIGEVTMRKPMLYKGYKITQNSFSQNEHVIRGSFLVRDPRTGESEELDASPGDPVRISLGGSKDLFLQVDSLAPGVRYQILNLANQKVVAEGTVQSNDEGPPIDTAELEKQLSASKYSVMVAALFPNFRIDENNQPSTLDERFENPAVFVMLFKNGQPNGYTWLFQRETAQNIIGQPHPEVEMHFTEYRKMPDTTGSNGLRDYEVHLVITQKEPRKPLADFWIQPGVLHELENVDEAILETPNVNVDNAHGSDTSTPQGTEKTTDTLQVGGAGPATPAAGGEIMSQSTSPPIKQSGTNPALEVVFLGKTTGNVTFLGFMRDPSVGWLFSGCLIIIGGTLIAFLITYREVWFWHDSEEGILYLATQVRGTSPAAHREFDRLVNAIAEMAQNQNLEAEDSPELQLPSPSK